MRDKSRPQQAPAAGSPAPSGHDTLPDYAERVLDVVELIPPGRVMTYGDVAEWLQEGGPRQVGRAMALYGAAVPWWRVVRADGALLPGHELAALGHYRTEGTPLRETAANSRPRAAVEGERGSARPSRTKPRASDQRGARTSEKHLPRIDMRRARWDGEGGTRAHI